MITFKRALDKNIFGDLMPETENGLDLPYNADYEIIDKIITLVGREDGKITTSELYSKLANVKNTPTKSYNLSMAKFLGILTADGYKLKLTTLGRETYVRDQSQRKSFLANNLPKSYKMILSWIDVSDKKTMLVKDIKNHLIKESTKTLRPAMLQGMITNFARYASELGVITYAKGGEGKCAITDFGITVLSSPTQQTTSGTSLNAEQSLNLKESHSQPATSDADNVITIIARVSGRDLPNQIIEVYSEEDLEQLDVFKRMYARRLSKK